MTTTREMNEYKNTLTTHVDANKALDDRQARNILNSLGTHQHPKQFQNVD